MSGTTDPAMRVYLEANFFIRSAEAEAEVVAACQRLLTAGEEEPGRLVTSELSLAEVMVGPLKFRGQPSAAELASSRELPIGAMPWLSSGPIGAAYLSVIENSPRLRVAPIERSTLLLAAQWRALWPTIKLPDAIHAATAEQEGCTHIVTGDSRLGKALVDRFLVVDAVPSEIFPLIEALSVRGPL